MWCLAAAKRPIEAAPRQKKASDINQPKRPNWYSLMRWDGLYSGSQTWSIERIQRNATPNAMAVPEVVFVLIPHAVAWETTMMEFGCRDSHAVRFAAHTAFKQIA